LSKVEKKVNYDYIPFGKQERALHICGESHALRLLLSRHRCVSTDACFVF